VKRLASAISEIAAARLKDISPLRPKLAIVLGTGFHHVLDELLVEKKSLTPKYLAFLYRPSPVTQVNCLLDDWAKRR
jgi:hypothetical protein